MDPKVLEAKFGSIPTQTLVTGVTRDGGISIRPLPTAPHTMSMAQAARGSFSGQMVKVQSDWCEIDECQHFGYNSCLDPDHYYYYKSAFTGKEIGRTTPPKTPTPSTPDPEPIVEALAKLTDEQIEEWNWAKSLNPYPNGVKGTLLTAEEIAAMRVENNLQQALSAGLY